MQPYLPILRSLLSAWGHQCTRGGQPTVLIRINCCNFPLLTNLVPLDVIRDYVVFSNEVEFWWCDMKTRESGKVHKCYRLIDLKGMSSKSVDRKFLKVFEQSSKISEFLHPQLVAQTILVNAPSFIRWVVEALKAVGVSRRALDKLWVHKQVENKCIAEHDDILRLMDKETLPSYLGGLCNCVGGCVPGTPNSRTAPLDLDVREAREEIREAKKRLIAERQAQLDARKARLNLASHDSSNLDGSWTDNSDKTEPSRPADLPPRLAVASGSQVMDGTDEDNDYDVNEAAVEWEKEVPIDESVLEQEGEAPGIEQAERAGEEAEFHDAAEDPLETLLQKLQTGGNGDNEGDKREDGGVVI
eukprot:GHVQ01006258.1.p1 GENE.GHVQ01006258.1~~GHVQ01006258.1.p1  ORF type:complete len:358 (+),score=46.46 GHVQ01006258.1:959-2032(+)